MHVRRFRDMLHCHGMTQHVHQPTHQDGHILDLVIDRVNSCVADTVVAGLISDHRAVHCHLPNSKQPFKREERTYRKVKSINPFSFSSDIINFYLLKRPEHSLEELVCQYDHVLSELLEKHAPLKTTCLTIRPDAPWMDDRFFLSQEREAPVGATLEILQAHR